MPFLGQRQQQFELVDQQQPSSSPADDGAHRGSAFRRDRIKSDFRRASESDIGRLGTWAAESAMTLAGDLIRRQR
jgi:hypothetical protein